MIKKTLASFLMVFTFIAFTLQAQQKYNATKLYIFPQKDGFAPIVKVFDGAKKSIKLVIYEFTDTAPLNALIRAKKRGVRIKVLIQKKLYSPKGQYPSQTKQEETIKAFKKNHIPFHFASSRFRFTHEKAWLIDGKTGYISTGNFNISAVSYERNFVVKITNPAMVKEMEKVFYHDYYNWGIYLKNTLLLWSPFEDQHHMINLINSAKKSLNIYMPVTEDRLFIKAICKKAKNIPVNIIGINPTKDSPKSAAAFGAQYLVACGVKMRYFKIANISDHAKAIISDYGTKNQKAFVGSQNFTQNSIENNRELGVIIKNPSILEKLHKLFSRDWKNSKSVIH